MFTYLLIGLPFVAAVLTMDRLILKTRVTSDKPFRLVLAIMLVLTAVFDQLLTGLPIVEYNESKILGIYIWNAPIEDFMYTLSAVIGLGSLGKYYEQG